MSDDGVPGKALTEIFAQLDYVQNPNLADWSKIEVGESLFLYSPKEGVGSGFEFMAVEWSCSDGTENRYEYIFSGFAAFDGVRHLYFGQNGYIYCPDLPLLLALLSQLKQTQDAHCSHKY